MGVFVFGFVGDVLFGRVCGCAVFRCVEIAVKVVVAHFLEVYVHLGNILSFLFK